MSLLPISELAKIQDLYDENRFLEAYAQTQPLWQDPQNANLLSVDELILAARLAERLGGSRLSRWLFRKARAADPENPKVLYFTRFARRVRFHLLHELEHIENRPESAFSGSDLKASVLITDANYWSLARDVEHSNELAEQALALNVDRPWIRSLHAQILLRQDRWEEAVAAAEKSWAEAPGMPATAHSLALCLTHTGRVREAAEILWDFSSQSQSHELVQCAISCCCATAEATFPDGYSLWIDRAQTLLDKLDELTPLQDRESEIATWWQQLDVAFLQADYERIQQLTEQKDAAYAQRILKSLRENENGEMKLLAFKPIRQKHNTCLPTSVASVLYGFGYEIDDDALAREMTYGGTPTWRVADWLEANGFAVRHLILTADIAKMLIRNDLPFVFMTQAESSAHAMAAVGLDERTQTLIVHDPSSSRWARYFLEQLTDDEAPTGPAALVIVPENESGRLDIIPREAEETGTWINAYWKDREKNGIQAAEVWVEKLENAYPGNAVSRYMRAAQCFSTGKNSQAQEFLSQLATEFPQAVPIRKLLFACLHQTGNTALLRDSLQQIVEEKWLPGTEIKQEWSYAPPTYISQYCDILSLSAEHVGHCLREMYWVLQRFPEQAEAYHILGNIHYRNKDNEGSLLPYRLASQLEETSDFYARGYCDTLRSLGREAEGLDYLAKRAERNEENQRGTVAWTAVIDAYEDYGYPEVAKDILDQLSAKYPDQEAILSYAGNFWIRMGEWDKAKAALDALESTGHRPTYLQIACSFANLTGDWQQALEYCREWMKESPLSLNAKQLFLSLNAQAEGKASSLQIAEQWMTENTGHEGYESLLMDWYKQVDTEEKSRELLEERVRRNPDDAWAWRELGHYVMDALQLGRTHEAEELNQRLDEILDGCRRTSPDDAGTLFLIARREENAGHWEKAVELYFQGIEQEPTNVYGYGQIGTLFQRLSKEMQEESLQRLEEQLLNCVGALHGARQLAFMIAQRFGLSKAQEHLAYWKQMRENDPELIEAEADLWLYYGEGVSGAEQAIPILIEGIEHFPSHRELRVSLAEAYSTTLDEEKEEEVCRELVRRYPKDSYARARIISLLLHRKEIEQAEELLKESIRFMPLNGQMRQEYAQLLWQSERPMESIQLLQEALDFMPENLALRETLIDCLLDMGNDTRALEVARGGVAQFPDGAHCWYILGSTMSRSNTWTDYMAIEQAWRNALEFNAGLIDAADDLAVLLTYRQDYAEARKIMEAQRELQPDPSRIEGRLAWIDRMEGKDDNARQRLVRLLRNNPRYIAGWRLLMDWIEEDRNSDLARKMLKDWPENLMNMPDLRSQRLDLLEALEDSGFTAEELDQNWQQLQADFPQHLNLHLRRYDLLWERERYADAKEVLDKCQTFHPHSPHLLSRRVGLLAKEKKCEEALDVASRIWTMPDNDETWPSVTSWYHLEDAGWTKQAIQRIEDLLLKKYRVEVSAFQAMAEYLAKKQSKRSWRHLLHLQNRFPDKTTKRLCSFLPILDEVEWDAAPHRAEILSALAELLCDKIVLQLWEENKESWESQTKVWQQVGHSLLSLDRLAAREFLECWQEKPGIEMFIVVNYIFSLRDRVTPHSHTNDCVEEIYETGKIALNTLKHDYTVRFLACSFCEAALRLNLHDEFLESMEAYRGYIALSDEEAENFYMDGKYYFMPTVLLMFEQLLREKAEMTPQELEALENDFKDFKWSVDTWLWAPWIVPKWKEVCDG